MKSRVLCSLSYPGCIRWQQLEVLHICVGKFCSAFVTTRAALPQNRVEMLIGSGAEFENFIRLHFLSDNTIL